MTLNNQSQTEISKLEKKINLAFKDRLLLRQALAHRSYLNENPSVKFSNERLEFLGDSVLSLVTSTFLYNKFPTIPEGELTAKRSKLVQTKTLANIATKLDLGKCLFLSKGEEMTGGRTNQSLLADTFESLIGAIYIDQGIQKSQEFIEKHLLNDFEQILLADEIKDYKSLLQETVQDQKKPAPVYQLNHSEGPDHAKVFYMDVFCESTLIGNGIGKNKQEAEQAAAKDALEKLG